MRRLTLYKLDVPYRESMRIEGFEFGNPDASVTCSIVGSTRGDEVQQAYIGACIVNRLTQLEERGRMANDARVLVIPCANPLSMNVGNRFWPTDRTDINRLFPGAVHGTTTERVAAGIFSAVRDSTYGIQLASFNQQGDFIPHIRVMRTGEISDEALRLAVDFRMPCVVERVPDDYDKGTLNYVWQTWGTHAFSLYSQTTDRIDHTSANKAVAATTRFLTARKILRGRMSGGVDSISFVDTQLVNVRTEESAGYLESHVKPGDSVKRGQELGVVLDAFDAHVRERLIAPTDGVVFFCRVKDLVQQRMVVFRIAPEL